MTKILYYTSLYGLLIAAGCVSGLQTTSIDDQPMVSVHPEVSGEQEELKGIPVLDYNEGYFAKDANWWDGSKAKLNRTSEARIFECENIGPNYSSFGAELSLLDMIEDSVVVRITAKADGKDGDVPLLTLQFDDAQGYQANANRPAARIGNTEEYVNYYFPLTDNWIQNWPDNHSVNGAAVNKMLFFVNPGGSGFTGKIYIKEMRALPIDSMQENPEFKIPPGKEGGLVDNFQSNTLEDWSSTEKYQLTPGSDSSMKVKVNGAGPDYGSFGKKLPYTMNMENAYKLRVRIKYQGEDYPQLRVDAKDYKGRITNAQPASNHLEPGEEYKDYFFIYKDNWRQKYPEEQPVDPKRITSLLFFVNPGGSAWSGTFHISEIEVIYTGSAGRNSER